MVEGETPECRTSSKRRIQDGRRSERKVDTGAGTRREQERKRRKKKKQKTVEEPGSGCP